MRACRCPPKSAGSGLWFASRYVCREDDISTSRELILLLITSCTTSSDNACEHAAERRSIGKEKALILEHTDRKDRRRHYFSASGARQGPLPRALNERGSRFADSGATALSQAIADHIQSYFHCSFLILRNQIWEFRLSAWVPLTRQLPQPARGRLSLRQNP